MTGTDTNKATSPREELARAIADGFTNGNEQYDEATESQRFRYNMAADAVQAIPSCHPVKAASPERNADLVARLRSVADTFEREFPQYGGGIYRQAADALSRPVQSVEGEVVACARRVVEDMTQDATGRWFLGGNDPEMTIVALADALDDAPPKPSEAPAMGWKLVPVEPTETMIDAALDAHAHGGPWESPFDHDGFFAEIYRAMLAASTPESAPQPALGEREITEEMIKRGVRAINEDGNVDLGLVDADLMRKALTAALSTTTSTERVE